MKRSGGLSETAADILLSDVGSHASESKCISLWKK